MLDGDKNQLELFWNSNPFLIIKLLQGLQFYFCIVVSFLIMFWGTFVFIPVPGYEFHPRNLPIICVSSCMSDTLAFFLMSISSFLGYMLWCFPLYNCEGDTYLHSMY